MQGNISEIIDFISSIEFRVADLMKDNSSIRYGIQTIPQRLVCLIWLRLDVISSTEDISIDVVGFNKERNISIATCLIGVVVYLNVRDKVLRKIV